MAEKGGGPAGKSSCSPSPPHLPYPPRPTARRFLRYPRLEAELRSRHRPPSRPRSGQALPQHPGVGALPAHRYPRHHGAGIARTSSRPGLSRLKRPPRPSLDARRRRGGTPRASHNPPDGRRDGDCPAVPGHGPRRETPRRVRRQQKCAWRARSMMSSWPDSTLPMARLHTAGPPPTW